LCYTQYVNYELGRLKFVTQRDKSDIDLLCRSTAETIQLIQR